MTTYQDVFVTADKLAESLTTLVRMSEDDCNQTLRIVEDILAARDLSIDQRELIQSALNPLFF